MEAYDPATVFSSIDQWGRYAFGNQPAVAAWNLARFAETLLPLIAEDPEQAIALATESLGALPRQLRRRMVRGHAGEARPADEATRRRTPLAEELLALLEQSHVDYTSFFRALGRAARGDAEPARGLFVDLAAFDGWLARWRALGPDAGADGPGQSRVHPA